MDTFNFTLIVEGGDLLSESALEVLFEAGCTDATFGERDGVHYAEFDREAPSFASAVSSAIRAIEAAVPGARVTRLEPEELVSISAIAERTGRTRESVRLLCKGARGPGGFPPPLRWVDARTTLWRWADVAGWFEHSLRQPVDHSSTAHIVAMWNGVLDARRHGGEVSDEEVAELARFVRQDGHLRDLLKT
jgi:hypothetical protein